MALRENPGAAGVRGAQRHGERAAGTRQFEWLARAGLAARAVVSQRIKGAGFSITVVYEIAGSSSRL